MASSICRVNSARRADLGERNVLHHVARGPDLDPLGGVARGAEPGADVLGLPERERAGAGADAERRAHASPAACRYRAGDAFGRCFAGRDRLADGDALAIGSGQRESRVPPLHLVHDVLEAAVGEIVLGDGLGPELERAEGRLAHGAEQQPQVVAAPAR